MAKEYADYVVVGAGVAGGLVANELAKAGKDVLVLEAGPRRSRWEIVERFRNQANKDDFQICYDPAPYAPQPEFHPNNGYLIQTGPHDYNCMYLRVVGGTTWHWAAAAWRFLPNDFKVKSLYGVGADWPIEYAELEPWYLRAEQALGVWGPGDEDLGSPRSAPYPMENLPISYNEQQFKTKLNQNGMTTVTEPAARNSRPYDNRPVCCGNNDCMPICPIGAMYNGIVHADKCVKSGARLKDSCVVYKIEKGSDNKITAVIYKDPQGNDHRVEGKHFILAANGIETPKLLLQSDVGNSSGMIGRNLMDHPGTHITFLTEEPLWPGRGAQEMTSMVHMRDGDWRGEMAAKKIQLSNLNRIIDASKDVLEKNSPFIYGKDLEAKIKDRASRYARFDSFHELMPDPANRIYPSTQKDAMGIPKPEFWYSISDYVRRGAENTAELYRKSAELMGGTEINVVNDYANNNHICGTVGIGSDPKNFAFDANCISYDHPNLYVATSGAMPTVGTVNCTLTLCAMALRLTDHLIKESQV